MYCSIRDISIPAPARGRTFTLMGAAQVSGYFNSRPREGANFPGFLSLSAGKYFNSRPREGANSQHTGTVCDTCDFNSRPREGANLMPFSRSMHRKAFQFPPPRGGELGKKGFSGTISTISIPAPARGRTPPPRRSLRQFPFQFPPPRGGELLPQSGGTASRKYFNSRPREGANSAE